MEKSKAEKGEVMGCNFKWSDQGRESRTWYLNKGGRKQSTVSWWRTFQTKRTSNAKDPTFRIILRSGIIWLENINIYSL